MWCDVTVESLGLVSVNTWTNGSGYDDLELFLYDPAGSKLTSDWGSSDDASIDHSASITGTYKVKAVLTEAYGGGTRTISVSSNCPLEQAGPPTSVSLITDKLVYSLGETMTTTVTICSPSQTNVTFQRYWLVPQLNVSLPVLSVQLPGGYDNTINFSFAIPYLGPTPFGNTFYVQLLDASGTILDADSTWSVYSPGAGMQEQDVDITEEIKSIIEGVEFPN